jgi:hypothetical protein
MAQYPLEAMVRTMYVTLHKNVRATLTPASPTVTYDPVRAARFARRARRPEPPPTGSTRNATLGSPVERRASGLGGSAGGVPTLRR